MRRRYIGTILAGLAFAAWACRGDPTAELRSGPATLSLSINFGALDVGKKGPVLVVARASRRFDTLTQAMSSTNPTAPNRTHSGRWKG